MTISEAKSWTSLQGQGFYVPGSGQAAKGLMAGVSPPTEYAAHKQRTA
jgi:hypothetical protein